MSHDPGQSNGKVDVSVLVPVLNEERHIRESVAAMLSQRYDGAIEFLFMDGRSEDRTKAILQEMSAAEPRIRVLDNPRQRTTFGLNIGLQNARGDYIVRMDAHTEYPPEYVAKGIERLQRGDGVEWVTGPQVPHGVGPWSRRVAIALRSWLGAGGSAKWEATEEKDIDTGVFTGVWRRATLDHALAEDAFLDDGVHPGQRGLVPGCQPVAELWLDDALALAREIAGKSPQAVRGAKALLNLAGTVSLADGFLAEERTIGALIGSPNQVEAVTAYFEKREPRFAD